MSGSSYQYDVLLCHNSKEKPILRDINEALRQEHGLRTFLDESTFVGGEQWEVSIRAAMARSKACAIILGINGWGAYQLTGEAKPALARREQDSQFRVIPVLLPDAKPEELLDLREFFDRTHWVDFRSTEKHLAIRTLARAICGKNPFPEGRPELTSMRVSFDSIRWDVTGRRNASILYRGKQLREARDLLTRQGPEFTDLARDFLSASERQQNQELGLHLGAHAIALANRPSQLELAANLALEAICRFPSPEAHAVLRSIPAKLPLVVAQFGHPAPVTAAAVDPAGNWIATACVDGTVAFWDGRTLIRARWKHGGTVRTAVFEPNGAWLATGGDDGLIVVWDLARQEPSRRLSHGEPVTKLEVRVVTGGGLLLVSSGWPGRPGKFSLWSTVGWTNILSIGGVADAALDAGGKHFVFAYRDRVAIQMASSGDLVSRQVLGSTVVGISTHPINSLIAANTFARQIWLGNIEPQASEMRPIGNSILPTSLPRFSPGGRWLAAAGDDYRIRIWDLTTQSVQFCPYKGLIGVDYGFSPKDTYLSIISKEAKSITFRHVQSGEVVFVREYDKPAIALFSSDEDLVLAASSDCDAEMLEMPRRGEALWGIGLGYTWVLNFSPDGQWLAWIGRKFEADLRIGSPGINLIKVQTGAIAWSVELSNTPQVHATEIVFGPEVKQIAAVGDGGVRVWDLDGGAEHSASPAPTWATPGSARPVSELLEAPGFVEARRKGFSSATATLDGRWIAIDHGGQLVSVWDLTSSKETLSFSARASVSAMAFSPAGDLFAAGDDMGGISVWMTNGTALAQLEHNDAVIKLAFSSDSTRLAAASADSGVQMWIVGPQSMADQVRRRLSRGLSREEWERYLSDEPYPEVDVRSKGA